MGLHAELRPVFALPAGFAAYLALAAGYGAASCWLGVEPALHKASMRANARAWPRARSAKLTALVAIAVVNPVIEELLMRGLLVHQWSLLLGSAQIPIAAGLLFNTGLHAYQGWRVQAWHALFFAPAVALLFSPLGLAGGIGAHFAGDTVPLFTLRRRIRRRRSGVGDRLPVS